MGHRNPRREAFERVGGRYDVRVLEPSPPAVSEPPWFADDPLDGGEVLPIERAGAKTWADVCREEADQDLLMWCWDRWLVPRPALFELPPKFVETRLALHELAEKVVAPARETANGKIGLRFTHHGFGSPFFDGNRQVRVERGVLLRDEEPDGTYGDAAAARVLGDWYGFSTFVLEQVRADATAEDTPSRVQLWPEHFDISVDLGDKVSGRRANYGGSPGDEDHDDPYLYVGPWGPYDKNDPFWNEPFGASLSYAALIGDGTVDPVPAALAFFRRAKELLCPASG